MSLKPEIRIHTSTQYIALPLETTNPVEVYDKSRKLKEWARVIPETYFVVYLSLPSRMNQPGFVVDELI